jgi:hypothetical protein
MMHAHVPSGNAHDVFCGAEHGSPVLTLAYAPGHAGPFAGVGQTAADGVRTFQPPFVLHEAMTLQFRL